MTDYCTRPCPHCGRHSRAKLKNCQREKASLLALLGDISGEKPTNQDKVDTALETIRKLYRGGPNNMGATDISIYTLFEMMGKRL